MAADVVQACAEQRASASVPFTIADAIRDARAHVDNPELVVDSQHVRKILRMLLAAIDRPAPK